MNHDHIKHVPETVKHAADIIIAPSGVFMGLQSLGLFVETVVNPLLAMAVLVTSLVWGIYRIREHKENKK